jgi:hypothetical protein
MRSARSLKTLVGLYLAILLFLLGSVVATPLVIRHGVSLTHELMIEEETLESILILVLLTVSMLILSAFRDTLQAYRRVMQRAEAEKAAMGSKLAEAFDYIGAVNVEIHEISSVLCGVDHYPKSKKEFKQLLDGLATKAMTVTGAPWIVIRMINRCSGRTVAQCAVERSPGLLPPVTAGNRTILEGRRAEGLRTIGTAREDIDLITVAILPAIPLGEEETLLVKAIVNQIEMLFLLYRSGGLRPVGAEGYAKGESHDTHI